MFRYNRAQRRKMIKDNRKRGVGFTRQYSSARVRRKYGRPSLGEVSHSELNAFWKDVVGFVAPLGKNTDSATPILSEDTFDDSSEEAIVFDETKLSSLLNHNAKTCIAELNSGEWDDYLPNLHKMESEGKNRKTILSAIDKRMS